MPDIQAVAAPGFGAQVAGAVAVPLASTFVPGINQMGPLAPLALGAATAYFGKGAVRKAGQGAVLVSSAALIGPLIGQLMGGGGRQQTALEGF
jgi:hypothetical protein